MFSPAPEGPVSLTVPVAEGEQAAEPETKPGAPGIGFTAPMDELAASVLTPEEQALYEKGAQVLIELVESPDAQVPEADKTIVTAAAGEYTVGEYLDVSLIKTINGVSDTVSETNRALRVVFTIPTDLQAAGRQFAVIRVHDGKAEFLKTVSSTASTITVESDRFSTYAIVYREAPATATPAPTQTSTATPAPTDSVPDTGDDTALPGWTALLLGCAAALTAAVLTLRRKDRRG